MEQSAKIIEPSGGTGTSIFDPVLCEIAYRWFCPPGGLVLDPFAGGSVRGIVAGCLGRKYIGIDLSLPQVEENRKQAEFICVPPLEEPSLSTEMPMWIDGNSKNIKNLVPPQTQADFIFSCPPYVDLEVYSDDPQDLSTMAYPDFLSAYREIISETCALLRDNRFACFVVGDVRDKHGCYYGFPWHTVQAFEMAGLRLYNEAVLITAIGSLPIRVGRQFVSGRKLGKTHQNVLIFVKGDFRAATAACGEVEFGDIETPE